MAEIPNLAGIATKELVEHIGTGKFVSAYINWSRTMNLLRVHAPGWMVESVMSPEGSLLHRAPVGAYLLIRFRHVDGTTTPEVPQAVMDHRNAAIPFDRITARDITDTQRRGACMAAAMIFGLAYELWAKMPLESGYSAPESSGPELPAETSAKAASARDQFMTAAAKRGLNADGIRYVESKIKGDYNKAIELLSAKSAADIENLNAQGAAL